MADPEEFECDTQSTLLCAVDDSQDGTENGRDRLRRRSL